jgi:hypothetical protein
MVRACRAAFISAPASPEKAPTASTVLSTQNESANVADEPQPPKNGKLKSETYAHEKHQNESSPDG